jgi:AraC-like DNA-binding protein
VHYLSGFFNIIILLGSIQGFIICTLLFFSKVNLLSNRLLGFFIFLIALASLNTYLFNQTWYESSSFFQLLAAIVPMVIIMPLGPLLFFYTKASLNPGYKLTKKNKYHFYPVIIDLFPYLTAIFYIVCILSGFIKNHQLNLANFIDTYNVYSDIPRWISLTCYLLLSIKYVNSYKKRPGIVEKTYQLKWLKQCIAVLLCFQLIWLLYLIPYVIPKYTNKLLDEVDWYPIYVPLAILSYWLGIKGYLVMKYQLVNKKTASFSASLPPAIVDQIVLDLKKAMEKDAVYLNPDLNLSILSQYTGIPAKTISAVINQHLHKSFNEFVNEYRVEAFKEKVQQPEMNNLTFAGIAFECGFNSQATFQRTFKQVTGKSPSEFKNQVLQTN